VQTLALKDDDHLLFYTDGLIDAANFDGDIWGRDRMLEMARQCVGDTAEQMIKNLLRYRMRFVGLANQVDDTSIITIRVEKRGKTKSAD
jgi:sigma-B regulation protein RsbU (phosphoserine phosphatase)